MSDESGEELYGWKVLYKLLQKDKSAPSLRKGSSFSEKYQINHGSYRVETWSDDFLFGIRTLVMNVEVKTEKDQKIFSESVESKSSRVKEKIQFTIKESDGPCSLKITLSCGGLKSINAHCNVQKKVPVEEITEDEENLLFDVNNLSPEQKKKYEKALEGWTKKDMLTLNLNLSLVNSHLERSSQFKQKAFDVGMIRPFLLLVSMHPEKRLVLASALEIDLFLLPEYPDSHAESWHLIDKNLSGIISRTNEAVSESLNPFALNCTWYQTIQRVSLKAFVNRDSLTKKNQDVSPDLQSSFKGAKKSAKDTISPCQDPSDNTLFELENLFIRGFLEQSGTFKQSKEDEEFKNQINEFQNSELYKKRFPIMMSCGFTNPEIVTYALFQLANAEAAYQGETSWTNKKKDSKAQAVTIGIPVIALALGPMIAIPAMMFVVNSLRFTFRSTHGKLLVPVIVLLLHRLCLNANGLKLSTFYPKK